MNRSLMRLRVLSLTSALSLAASFPLSAQTTTPATPTAGAPTPDSTSDEIILNPFIVNSDADKGGYGATSTLAGTRVRTDLKDVASAISVVTKQFLLDTGAVSTADLLVYTPSTEVSGLRGNFSGVAGTGIYQENTISSNTRVRGLDSADNTRDYFLTDIPADFFNVDRVDLQRGPNSILFGIGSPAGIINTSINDAAFKTAYRFSNRIDQYGSNRNVIDLNQNIIPQVLSLRVTAVKDDQVFEQKPAYNNSSRYYGALRFDPKIFGEDSRTSIRAKFEAGRVNSNNPRTIPPGDDYTRWFRTGTDAYGNPGYNKIILNAFSATNPNPVAGGPPLPGGIGGVLSNGLQLSNQTRSFWPDVINYYEGIGQSSNNVPGAKPPSGTSIKTIVAQPNSDLGVRDASGNTLGNLNTSFLPRAIPMMKAYAPNVGNTGGFPGTPIPGGVYYSNVVLQDKSIFDFYKKLLDGPNKHEWQNWKAYNIAFDQSFLKDRVAFEVAYDHQTFTNGSVGGMAGENYNINIDVNATYADGTPNPNAGRPYAGDGASAPGLNNVNTTDRTTVRFTPTAELRFSDFLGDTSLAKILGKHNFTGLYERNTVVKTAINFAEYATTPQFFLDNRRNDTSHTPSLNNKLGADRSFEWVVYLGPSLLNNNTKGLGTNLANVQAVIAPPSSQTATNFNATWTKPNLDWNALNETWRQSNGSYVLPSGVTVAANTVSTLPNGTHVSPGYVNPTAPPAGFVDPTGTYTYVNPVNGNTIIGTQVDNPANYKGWTQQPISWMSYANPTDFPSLVESANRTRFRDISKGFTWQGYLLGGDLVPTFGWRKDNITTFQTQSPTDPLSGYTSTSFLDEVRSRTDAHGESTTWGIVYHLPKAIKLPWDSTISLFFDKGKNFKADATRLNLAGLQIPNANGNTKEYGITFTTLHDKLSLKVSKFKTKVANATLADTQGNSIGGLGQNGYVIADASIWGYGWATYLQDALRGGTAAVLSSYGDYAGADGFTRNSAAEIAAYDNYNINGGTAPNGRTYAGGLAVTNAWVKAPFPASFFASYNLTPNLDHSRGAASGHLRDSFDSTTYNDSSGPVLGGGSSFGNHQTTVDNLSDGTEIELTYQPIKTWNITANFSKVKATHENIDPVSIAFIGALTKFYNGPAGQIRQWGNSDTTMLRGQWNNSIVAPYAVLTNQLGQEAPEVSPWRFNLVSTYTFDHSIAKGFFIGGGFREEAGKILGYHFNPNVKNKVSSDPNFSDVLGLTLGGLDVNQPFRGKNEEHVDAWIGYSRKITKKVGWRIQLNLQNVGENDHLVASGVNPDGSVALARIIQGTGYRLENSFDF